MVASEIRERIAYATVDQDWQKVEEVLNLMLDRIENLERQHEDDGK